MILAIDIGNSNIVYGLYKDGRWVIQWRLESKLNFPVQYHAFTIQNHLLENNIKVENVNKVIISSVVPEITGTLFEAVSTLFPSPPLVITEDIFPNLGIKIEKPHEIGTDLVSNAVAAFEKFHDYSIAVDFGTALTFTATDNRGNIIGVSIAPGLETAINSLTVNTSKLPPVPVEYPKTAIGKNTVHAIQSGVFMGYCGMVEKLILLYNEELNKSCKVIATGGLARVIKPLHHIFEEIDETLTLEGMRLIAEKAW